MVSLEQDGNVFVLYWPIVFHPDTVGLIHAELDKVEAHEGPTSLVLASKHPRIFHAGMDLKYMMDSGVAGGLELFALCMRLYGRLLSIGVPTVCAINGHIAAGGLMAGLAADYRVMSQDQGSLKMSEVVLGFVLPRGGNIVLKAKLSAAVHRDLLLKGKVFTPQEALDKEIVDKLVPKENVLETAKQWARELADFGQKKDVYRMLKYSTYKDEIDIARKAEVTKEEFSAVEKTFNPKL